jgi:hypothetical protein
MIGNSPIGFWLTELPLLTNNHCTFTNPSPGKKETTATSVLKSAVFLLPLNICELVRARAQMSGVQPSGLKCQGSTFGVLSAMTAKNVLSWYKFENENERKT